MDLSTTQRQPADGVGELRKTRVAKSVFSIRNIVDVEESGLTINEDGELNGKFFFQPSKVQKNDLQKCKQTFKQ